MQFLFRSPSMPTADKALPGRSEPTALAYDRHYVNDASLLPEPPGMNPQGTLMAIVSRNSTHYLEASRAG